MNILFLHSSSDLYGASKVLLTTIHLLKKNGYTPIVVLSKTGPLSEALTKENIEVILIPLGILRKKYFSLLGLFNRIGNIQSAKKKIIRICSEKNIELIYSNTTTVLVGGLVAKKLDIRHIYHVHEIIEHPKWLGFFLHKFVTWSAQNIIAVSAAVNENIKKNVDNKKTWIIHNGLDIAQFLSIKDIKNELKPLSQKIIIGMIGRISAGKGQDYFIDIADELIKKKRNLLFLIVGDPYPGNEFVEEGIKNKIRSLGLTQYFRFLGYRTDIVEIFNTLDVFVLPSTAPDSFPTVILEAMACRKAIVATTQGGALEMLIHNESGIFIPLDNAKNSAELMVPLLTDPTKRSAMGIAAFERVREKFSLSAFETRLMALINTFHA